MKILITVVVCMFCAQLRAQQYQDTNRGLYPNAIQGTVNARNTALGVRYSHLFQRPFMGVPVGLYGSFSNTIKPDKRYNNYPYERKYSIGGMITLPYTREMNEVHTMFTVGAIYNEHPIAYGDQGLQPGQHAPDVYETSHWGVDIGVQVQINRFTAHLSVDAVNFFRYAEIGVGYCFYRLRK